MTAHYLMHSCCGCNDTPFCGYDDSDDRDNEDYHEWCTPECGCPPCLECISIMIDGNFICPYCHDAIDTTLPGDPDYWEKSDSWQDQYDDNYIPSKEEQIQFMCPVQDCSNPGTNAYLCDNLDVLVFCSDHYLMCQQISEHNNNLPFDEIFMLKTDPQ